MDAVIDAPNKEVALTQINAMKGYSKKALNLPLSEIWTKYEVHPDRARPLTPHEPLMYRSTLQEFIDYAHGITGNPKNKRSSLSSICEVTSEFVSGFVDYLKTTKIAVDTHNRKLRRFDVMESRRKIFGCIIVKEYSCQKIAGIKHKPLESNKRENFLCRKRVLFIHPKLFHNPINVFVLSNPAYTPLMLHKTGHCVSDK